MSERRLSSVSSSSDQSTILTKTDPKTLNVITVFSGVALDKVGWLHKRGEMLKSFKKKYCVVFQNVLVIFQDENSSSASSILSLEFAFAETAVIEDQPTTYCFCVRCGLLPPWYFCATSQAEMNEWIRYINMAKFAFLKEKVAQEAKTRREVEKAAKVELQMELKGKMQLQEENKLILEQVRMGDEFQTGLSQELSNLKAELNIAKRDAKKANSINEENERIIQTLTAEKKEREKETQDLKEQRDSLAKTLAQAEKNNLLLQQQGQQQKHIIAQLQQQIQQIQQQLQNNKGDDSSRNQEESQQENVPQFPTITPLSTEDKAINTDEATAFPISFISQDTTITTTTTPRVANGSVNNDGQSRKEEHSVEDEMLQPFESTLDDGGESVVLEAPGLVTVDDGGVGTWRYYPNVLLQNQMVVLGKGKWIVRKTKDSDVWDVKSCQIRCVKMENNGANTSSSSNAAPSTKKFVIPPSLAKALRKDEENFVVNGLWELQLKRTSSEGSKVTLRIRFEDDASTLEWVHTLHMIQCSSLHIQASLSEERRQRAEDQLSVKMLEQDVLGQSLAAQAKELNELKWKIRVMEDS